MHALISTLDEGNNGRVIELWEALAERCGLRGILSIPLPHFSWHGAESYSLHLLEPLLASWAEQAEPFQVRTSGLGIFTGDKPVIHLRLVTTRRLLAYHNQIWQRIQQTDVNEPSPHYTPDSWLPHITLGIEDVNFTNLGCAIHQLAFQSYDWTIQVDTLALVSHTPNQSGEIIREYQLGSTHGA